MYISTHGRLFCMPSQYPREFLQQTWKQKDSNVSCLASFMVLQVKTTKSKAEMRTRLSGSDTDTKQRLLIIKTKMRASPTKRSLETSLKRDQDQDGY